MIPYISLVFSLCVLFIFDHILPKQKGRSFGVIVAVIITIIFSIIRNNVGYDYANYVEFFSMDISKLIDRGLEWGFICSVSLLRLYTDNYFWLFFIYGVFTILLVCRGIRLYTSNFKIAFLIFILTPGLFLNSFSILRQALAIVLLFNAFFYYYKKEINKALLWAGFAALFHYTVIAALPFLMISPKLAKNARIIVLIGVPISLILSQFNLVPKLIGLILSDSRFAAYATFSDIGTSLSKLIILNTVAFFYLCFYKLLNNLNKTLLVIVTLGLILTNICSDVAAITRIGYYFKIFDCVLLANIVSLIKNPVIRAGVIVCIVTYYFCIFLNALNVDSNLLFSPKLTPYQTFLD